MRFHKFSNKNNIFFCSMISPSSDQIKLEIKSLLRVPLQTYDEFYFIVNEKEFKTTRIISDLLSPKICQIHRCDPTINSFTINTQQKGDFSFFLKLTNFESIEIPSSESQFILEVCEILGNEFIQIDIKIPDITENNVFDHLQNHLKSQIYYSKPISNEIDFISSNLFSLIENKSEQLMQLDINTIERLIDNTELKIIDEDQLLKFINHLYSSDSEYSKLYKYVIFQNIKEETIEEFLNIYNINDINNETWTAISYRLKQQIIKNDEDELDTQHSRYKIAHEIFYNISTNNL